MYIFSIFPASEPSVTISKRPIMGIVTEGDSGRASKTAVEVPEL